MELTATLKRMRDAGVQLVPDGFALKVRYPIGTDPRLLADIGKYRTALEAKYNERAAIREYDAGFDRNEAERLAIEDIFQTAGTPAESELKR